MLVKGTPWVQGYRNKKNHIKPLDWIIFLTPFTMLDFTILLADNREKYNLLSMPMATLTLTVHPVMLRVTLKNSPYPICRVKQQNCQFQIHLPRDKMRGSSYFACKYNRN